MGVGGGGRRHGDQEGTEGEIILMILSNAPFLYEEQKKCFRMRITGDYPRLAISVFNIIVLAA